MSNPTLPNWAKAVAIIQICLGSLGIFIQFYKIVIPIISRFKNIAASEFVQQDFEAQRNFTKATQLIDLSESQATFLTILGVIGLVLCVVYIIAGVKMLKPFRANYNLSKYVLITFILFNLINIAFFSTSNGNILILGIMFYVIVGLVIDITLLIIGMTSDKSVYGIESTKKGTNESKKSDERYLNEEEIY